LHYTPRKKNRCKTQCSTCNPAIKKAKQKSKIPLGIKRDPFGPHRVSQKKLPNHARNAGAPKERDERKPRVKPALFPMQPVNDSMMMKNDKRRV
jgi:hypothetical protein